ncbi:MAG: hypothetical protein ACUVX1_11580 [Chloroflexota bacterium]
MRLWNWWHNVQESYRHEFDERAQAQQTKAMRDAFIALAALLVLTQILLTLAAPAGGRGGVLAHLPIYSVAFAAFVFFISAGIRGAFTRRRAIIFAGVYLAAAIPVVGLFALSGATAEELLGLIVGIVLTATVIVAAAWRNA